MYTNQAVPDAIVYHQYYLFSPICFVFIFQVFDQYLNFISLEDDMFALRHQNSDAISYYGNSNVQAYYTFFYPSKRNNYVVTDYIIY